MPFRSEDVARYYDENTKHFLAKGQGGAEGAIHRAVWGEGVANRTEAFHFVHQKIRSELDSISDEGSHILDLGCGVGASLAFILDRSGGTGLGVTNSEEQARIARARGIDVEVLDFGTDRLPGPFDLAYGIESFVQAPDAMAFVANVARSVRPGGKLVLCDDFLGREPCDNEARWLEEFRTGWHVSSLMKPDALDDIAAASGLELIHDEDLTPFLELDRPRDVLLHLYMSVRRPFGGSGKRFLSLAGGSALRRCLKSGLVTYRYRVWRASADSL